VNLSERLELARREREGISVEPVDDGADDEAEVEPWDQPSPCPRCGTPGEVDLVDLVRARTNQRCAACGLEWVLTRQPAPAPR
jgi:hypothetical protein